ncbi:MAG: stage II sporulation protein D [Oscillospiraceae bacterium]|nr:stage II sporulation protein D [Oscillospiraceae bacterium]
MKQQIGFFILLCLVCIGILRIPYEVELPEKTVAEESSPDESISLQVLLGDRVEVMPLSRYLAGVVTAELPKAFPMEAKKAQAVAARTFALKQSGEKKHQEADVCTDSSCCQAWVADTDPEAEQAVKETDGLIVVYGKELIEATYFSCSGGRTEAAAAVWGNEVPYLQAVDSPGEEDAPRFREEIEVHTDSFLARLQTLYPEITPVGEAPRWFGEIHYTEGGGIDTAELCGICIKGTELRRLFGLRSTNIRFSVTSDTVTISTLGYGHRVGLSQHGARAMAEEGADFREILGHYYGHTEIKRLSLSGEA